MLEVKQFNFENISPAEVVLFNSVTTDSYDKIKNSYENVNYISFDGLGIDLEDDNKVFSSYGDYLGIMSRKTSNENCLFDDTPPQIVFNYNSSGNPKRETICFYGDCCKKVKFTLTNIEDVTVSQEKDVISSVVEIPLDIIDSDVSIRTLTVEFIETSNPNESIKIYSITDGTITSYTDFQSHNLLEEMNILSDDLSINEFNCEVISEEEFKRDQPINVYSNNKYYGTFFVENCERIAQEIYSVSAYNSVKKLDECEFEYFRPTNLKDLIDGVDVIGNKTTRIKGISEITGVTILNESNDKFNDILLHGNIPTETCRYTLCAMAYASDLWLDSSRSTGITFKSIPTTVNHNITADRILGEATLKRQNPITAAIYENVIHFYSTFEDYKTIDVTDVKERTKYMFDKPSEITGVTDVEYYLNDIVLNGSDDFYSYSSYLPVNFMDIKSVIPAENINKTRRAAVIVIEYTYPIRSTKIESNTPNERKNEVKINAFNLVASKNSGHSNLDPITKYDTIQKYISSAGTVTAKIILEDEKVGDLVTIETAFDGEITGIITNMNISFGYQDVAEIEVFEWKIG